MSLKTVWQRSRTFPLIALLSLPLIGCQAPTEPASNIVFIDNIAAIDAQSGLRPSVDLIIESGKIRQVGADLTAPKHTLQIIDGAGHYLIPGLWDAHVHLSYSPDIGHEVFFPLSLGYGITSLRDTGGHLEALAPAIAASQSGGLAPNFYFAGPLLDGPGRVYDGSSAGFPDISVGLKTPEDARAFVDELAGAGVSFVKAYEMLSPEVFAAIADQAALRGLPVSAHIPLSMSAEDAIASGANDMQHLRNLEFACAENAKELAQDRQMVLAAGSTEKPSKIRSNIHADQRAKALPRLDDEICNALIDKLAANTVYQTPTLAVTRFFTRRLFAEPYWKQTFHYMPPKTAAGWHKRSAALADYQPDENAWAHDAWVVGMIPRLSAAGVPILAGTDAPIAYLTPGASLH